MGGPVERFLEYISTVRGYSARTVESYGRVLESFIEYTMGEPLADCLIPGVVRGYEVYLSETKKLGVRSVNLHLSALSSFCKYLQKSGEIKTNPVKLVSKPKDNKRLPVYYREESLREYFEANQVDFESDSYPDILARMVILVLYATAIRRCELIGASRKDYDPERKVLRVLGKGNKVREVPVPDDVSAKLLLYLQVVDNIGLSTDSAEDPLFPTKNGGRLYPVAVDRIVKQELGKVGDITARKSPHVLRHTLATELLDNGADINSIKNLLGHSSLAATQVYTHVNIEKLRKVYQDSHPRAKELKK